VIFASQKKVIYTVKAAFSSIWSNGQVEAQVNCLQLQKRIVFGRANFDLLRLRVLCRV
jgi:transposase